MAGVYEGILLALLGFGVGWVRGFGRGSVWQEQRDRRRLARALRHHQTVPAGQSVAHLGPASARRWLHHTVRHGASDEVAVTAAVRALTAGVPAGEVLDAIRAHAALTLGRAA